MQTTMIPWHVFMNALEQQHFPQMKNWLDRWRFTNDGVFMARDGNDRAAPGYSTTGDERVVN
jgi:hypothetical protein